MPRVPSYGGLQATPTVQSSGALEAVTTKTHQGVFNGIQALQTAAQGLSGYAQEAFEQANKTRAQDAINNFTADLQNAFYGEDGLMRRKGQAVVAAENQTSFTDQGMEKFEEFASKYAKGMNPQQLEMYNEFLNKKRLEVNKSLVDHEVREGNAWSLEVYGTNAERAINSLAMNGGDRVARQQDIASIRDSYRDMGKIQGWSSEKTKLQGDKAVSGALVTVIAGLLKANEVDAARALFTEEGAKGNILGSDAMRVRGSLEKAIKAQDINMGSDQVAIDVMNDHDVTYQFADRMIEKGYMTPELEKKLEGVKDPMAIRDIYAREGDRLIQQCGGNIEKACQVALMGERVLEEGISVHSEEAAAMRGQILSAAETGTQVSEADIRKRVVARFPGLDAADQEELVKKTKSKVETFYKNRDAERVNTLEQAKQTILDPNSSAEPDLTGLTVKQVEDVTFFKDCASKGNFDTGLAETLKSTPALLKNMSDAEFVSAMLRVSPEDAKGLQLTRDHLLDKDTKTGVPPQAMVNDVFNEHVRTRYPGLNETDNRYSKSVLRDEFDRRVRQETQRLGRQPTREELEALVISFPVKIGTESFNIFDSSKGLKESSEGYDVIKTLAEKAGWGAIDDKGLAVFAHRLMASDDARLGMLNKRDVDDLFNQTMRLRYEDAMSDLRRKRNVPAGWELSPNDKARWLIAELFRKNRPKGALPAPVTEYQVNNIWGND